ncbi:MAG: helix-turn-helix domain-containing protein [Isosphaeraceae bacterium]
MAERTGIDRATISKLETGKIPNPTIGTLRTSQPSPSGRPLFHQFRPRGPRKTQLLEPGSALPAKPPRGDQRPPRPGIPARRRSLV